jgi:hypothetical protein
MQTTAHTHQVIFSRRVEGCPRCTELRLGMPARQWAGQRVRAFAGDRLADIRAHDCKRSGCLSICTFGDW